MFFLGYDISGIILFLKVLGGIVSLLLFIGIIVSRLGIQKVNEINVLKRAEHFSLFDDPKQEQGIHQKQWSDIENLFHSKNMNDWKMAILNADKMLDDVLTHLGYQGITLGEKLKSIDSRKNPWVEDLWFVHKLRNTIAHQGNIHISEREAYQAFRIFEHFFRTTGFIV